MAEFAKSIFGFGGFKKDSNSPSQQSSSSSHLANDQIYSDDQYYSQETNPSQENQFGIDSFDANDNRKKFLPKGLGKITPTTAVSTNGMVYGTTSSNMNDESNNQMENYDSENYLNQTFQKNQQQSQQYQKSQPCVSQLSKNNHHLQQPQSTTTRTTITNDKSGQPIIITTDETGQNLNHDLKNSAQPKGKLKVLIIEARDLLVNETSQPYVVCTFESSEFVTNAPNSYGKSPNIHNHNHNHQNNNHHINLHNKTHNNHALPVLNHDQKRPTMFQRQSSTQHLNFNHRNNNQLMDTSSDSSSINSSHPLWNHEATFDVVGSKSELDISVYDAAHDDAFLGHVRIFPSTNRSTSNKLINAEWYPLKARVIGERVCGSLKIEWQYNSTDSKKLYGPDDFEILRLLGKGTFGQVYQVTKRDTDRIYAMKILLKKLIVKKKEIAHTIGERNILVRTSAAASPFIVGLKFSFQTPTDLYLVTDYMSGGELFWHLQKEGRFPEDRAKFYIAELVLALEHLHDNDIVYRDLKPENILLDANGHIALCDFGLSKANLNNDGTTNTFCGTTEYLAPEVLLDESGYTKMVDFWSLGVLIFEMCCGWSPFYAENTQQMYKNIAFGKVRFPKEVLSAEGRSFVKGLLNRNPKHRLGSINDARELRAHPFFQDIDWNLLKSKSIPPPFKPHLASETDTSNFDPEFTNESTSLMKKQMELATTPLSPGIQANFKGFTYVDDSAMDDHFGKSLRYNTFKNPGSFIPGNPNLPPDEDVIEDGQIDEEDEMEIDQDQHLADEEFVNGRFDL